MNWKLALTLALALVWYEKIQRLFECVHFVFDALMISARVKMYSILLHSEKINELMRIVAALSFSFESIKDNVALL